ncbi:MAG: TorF family putative porin [Gallionella sp.]|nr:TorF family putative porin [Gallionella sp.]
MMTRKLLSSLILAAMAVPAVAMADSPFSGNVSLTTDYLFRGITQTDHGGAIQGGFDYANPNGLYAGVWASNISWLYTAQGYIGASSLELDTYAGYSGSFATDFSYDVGVLRYNYGGNANGAVNADTNEIYGSLGWKWISAKYSRSTGNLFGFTDSSGSGYLELNGSYTLAGPAVDLSAHYGKQSIPNNSGSEYSDYNVKAAKDFGGYTWAFMVSNTDITGDSARGVLSVSHSM